MRKKEKSTADKRFKFVLLKVLIMAKPSIFVYRTLRIVNETSKAMILESKSFFGKTELILIHPFPINHWLTCSVVSQRTRLSEESS